MSFASREEAGLKLGEYLHGSDAEIVLGLPRGGVIVAAGVAHVLHLPLDIVVVRKVGHPRHREFAVGALAQGDVVVLDQAVIDSTHVSQRELDEIISEEKERLREYQRRFVRSPANSLERKAVVLVDDGLATGATMEAAILSARHSNAQKVIVAVPVASESAFERVTRLADEAVALLVDPQFDAVGRYYERFAQTTDEEVLHVLNHNSGTAA
jgi:predicted phosphoribosyltransferase